MADKPKIDLNGRTAQELIALRDEIEAKLLELQAEAKATMLAKWQSEAEAAGLSVKEILATQAPPATPDRKSRKPSTKGAPVTHRGPNGETWSGRGRLPRWLAAMEAEGRKRDEFRI
ncbi:H-NS histone family protein [Siccirubricoccus phaeus]|uniref:H-NS histone family protein n=1 Tax=Siccirubricoccus phaeus TaxID=2595053 RepID=UPI0011F14F06|nr:H-NS histone family protein [Siccirubricoccus phaeus]